MYTYIYVGSDIYKVYIMILNNLSKMSANIILTTGIYDLIKDHVRRKKVTIEQEEILLAELKKASQVLRRDLPEDIASVNRKIKIKEHTAGEEMEFLLVGPKAAKVTKKKYSILSDVGLAIVGYKVGDVVKWPTPSGIKEYKIVSVETTA